MRSRRCRRCSRLSVQACVDFSPSLPPLPLAPPTNPLFQQAHKMGLPCSGSFWRAIGRHGVLIRIFAPRKRRQTGQLIICALVTRGKQRVQPEGGTVGRRRGSGCFTYACTVLCARPALQFSQIDGPGRGSQSARHALLVEPRQR